MSSLPCQLEPLARLDDPAHRLIKGPWEDPAKTVHRYVWHKDEPVAFTRTEGLCLIVTRYRIADGKYAGQNLYTLWACRAEGFGSEAFEKQGTMCEAEARRALLSFSTMLAGTKRPRAKLSPIAEDEDEEE